MLLKGRLALAVPEFHVRLLHLRRFAHEPA